MSINIHLSVILFCTYM